MEILTRDLRNGRVKVRVESLDDMWYLSNIIAPGDVVKSKTDRRIKGKEDIASGGKSERVTITVAIEVEKTDFKLETDSFRITGKVVDGPEDLISIGSYHTINVEADTVLTIIKGRWQSYELQMLDEAKKAALRPRLLIAVIDEGEAVFALVRESRIEYLDLSRNIGGKYDTRGRGERKAEFYGEAAAFLENTVKKENVSAAILAGTGFEKENLYSFIKDKRPELARICVIENTGSHGRNAVAEVMKRAKVKKIEEEIASVRDVKKVDRLLEEIGRGSGLAAYGLKDVESAAEAGAIEELLLCDDAYMKDRRRNESLMKNVKSAKGAVHIVNHESEAGSQLSALGGIGAVLRYRIN